MKIMQKRTGLNFTNRDDFRVPTSQADLRRINTIWSRDKDRTFKTECLLDQPEE